MHTTNKLTRYDTQTNGINEVFKRRQSTSHFSTTASGNTGIQSILTGAVRLTTD